MMKNKLFLLALASLCMLPTTMPAYYPWQTQFWVNNNQNATARNLLLAAGGVATAIGLYTFLTYTPTDKHNCKIKDVVIKLSDRTSITARITTRRYETSGGWITEVWADGKVYCIPTVYTVPGSFGLWERSDFYNIVCTVQFYNKKSSIVDYYKIEAFKVPKKVKAELEKEMSQKTYDHLAKAEAEAESDRQEDQDEPAPRQPAVNDYAILEVSPDASQEEIRKAYLRLARRWHPDRHVGKKAQAEAEEQFKKVQAAYDRLTDPNRDARKKYEKKQ